MSKPLITNNSHLQRICLKAKCQLFFLILIYLFIFALTSFENLCDNLFVGNAIVAQRPKMLSLSSSTLHVVVNIIIIIFEFFILSLADHKSQLQGESPLPLLVARLIDLDCEIIGKGYVFPHGLRAGIVYTRSQETFMSRPVKPFF